MIIAPLVKNLEKIISSNWVLSHFYAKPYLSVIKSEVDMAKISSKDKVLSIGCGAIPFTAVYIAKLTGAKVIAIDNDLAAIKKASQFVLKHNIGQLVDFKCISGEDVSAKDFTVAFVALQARPKDKIISNLLKTGTDIKIIARKPLSKLTKEYDMLPDCYNYQNICFHSKMKTFDASVLYNPKTIFNHSNSFQASTLHNHPTRQLYQQLN